MTRFHFERPDGDPPKSVQNILIHLNEFVPSQGYGTDVIIPVLMGYEDLVGMQHEDPVDMGYEG